MTRRWPIDHEAHNARVAEWRREEARRSAEKIKAIGSLGSGVPAAPAAIRAVTSGGVEGHARNAGKANRRVSLTDGAALAGTAGVESGPLTLKASKADAAPAQPASRAASSAVPKESAILKLVGLALELHPRMAWHARMNSGAMTVGKRFVRFAFKGCSDFVGQTTDGLFVAVEVKRPGGVLTEDQIGFLGRVSRNGGIAFVAYSAEDVAKGLG